MFIIFKFSFGYNKKNTQNKILNREMMRTGEQKFLLKNNKKLHQPLLLNYMNRKTFSSINNSKSQHNN
jgi:hypothetical protein